MKGGAWDERKGLDCRPAQDWPTPERCRPAWAPAHDGVAGIKTEKSGFTIEVTIPLLPPLVEAIEAGPTADLAFICGAAGTPLTKSRSAMTSARPAIRLACGNQLMGRKIGANRAALNDATVAQLNLRLDG